jgi:tryptophanyl-tRNA synthetase
MTMPYNPKKLRENTWNLAFNLLACGVDANNLFIQSMIPEHTELSWILSTVCSYGELSRMTQFKDKTQQVQEGNKDAFVSAGLFGYPVLQAADILIYKADFVPVGKDQEQHLELSRNIAQRFNNSFKADFFTLPEPLFTEVPKVMSPADPFKKMSKSLGEKHYIDVFADDKRIRKQVRSAVTDTGEETNGEMSAGVFNLFELLKATNKMDERQILMQQYESGNLKYVELKDAVADALIELSQKFRTNREELLSNKKEVKNQIKASASEIRKKAQETLREVKEVTGLSNAK